jgi:dGTPase
VHDVIDATQHALDQARPDKVSDVRAMAPLVQFSSPMRERSTALKRFLFQHLYRHAQVTATMDNAQQVVRELFAAYCTQPSEMPVPWLQTGADSLERAVCDYIAGMTDRFAAREHERLTGRRLLV